jgi:hypothetical protein
MDIGAIVAALKQQRERLDSAIEALVGIGSTSAGVSGNGRRRRRKMSAAARKRISQAMKMRWAARKRRQGAA